MQHIQFVADHFACIPRQVTTTRGELLDGSGSIAPPEWDVVWSQLDSSHRVVEVLYYSFSLFDYC